MTVLFLACETAFLHFSKSVLFGGISSIAKPCTYTIMHVGFLVCHSCHRPPITIPGETTLASEVVGSGNKMWAFCSPEACVWLAAIDFAGAEFQGHPRERLSCEIGSPADNHPNHDHPMLPKSPNKVKNKEPKKSQKSKITNNKKIKYLEKKIFSAMEGEWVVPL